MRYVIISPHKKIHKLWYPLISHFTLMPSIPPVINSLAPEKFEWNFRYVIFQRILVTDVWGISCEIALIWMSVDFINDQSTMVQVKAWCRQTTRHYLSQCWPRSLTPYGVTRPQWVLTHTHFCLQQQRYWFPQWVLAQLNILLFLLSIVLSKTDWLQWRCEYLVII